MRICLVHTDQSAIAELLIWLQHQTFPSDELIQPSDGYWWVAYDDEPVAFAALRGVLSWPNSGYMARCGVLKSHRGQGIQRKLLTVREKMARRIGMDRVITTTYNNPASANNLIRRGYLTYEPTIRWGAQDTIYWVKNL